MECNRASAHASLIHRVYVVFCHPSHDVLPEFGSQAVMAVRYVCRCLLMRIKFWNYETRCL